MIGRLRVALRTASKAELVCAKDEIRGRCDRFFRVNTHALNITAPKAIIDLDIASYSPPECLQPLVQCLRAGLRFSIIRGAHHHENPPHPLALLRARRKRPRRRAAEQRDELAASCMSRKEHCEG